MRIEGRTFIVSGGSAGLGLGTVETLLRCRANVAILDRAEPPAHLSASQVKYFQIDITNVDDIQAAIDGVVLWIKETNAELGGVINCAGVGNPSKILDWKNDNEPHSLDLWNFILAVNLTGTFNLTRLALKHLANVKPEGPDGERGVIVMVSSAAAFEGQPGQTAYSATKGAIRSMTLPLARDLSHYGIRVVTIAPGTFESNMTALLAPRARKNLESIGTMYPPRFGQPHEFAMTVKWALECPFVNGETVRLSGAGRLPGKL